jgi:hypothetical protein
MGTENESRSKTSDAAGAKTGLTDLPPRPTDYSVLFDWIDQNTEHYLNEFKEKGSIKLPYSGAEIPVEVFVNCVNARLERYRLSDVHEAGYTKEDIEGLPEEITPEWLGRTQWQPLGNFPSGTAAYVCEAANARDKLLGYDFYRNKDFFIEPRLVSNFLNKIRMNHEKVFTELTSKGMKLPVEGETAGVADGTRNESSELDDNSSEK